MSSEELRLIAHAFVCWPLCVCKVCVCVCDCVCLCWKIQCFFCGWLLYTILCLWSYPASTGSLCYHQCMWPATTNQKKGHTHYQKVTSVTWSVCMSTYTHHPLVSLCASAALLGGTDVISAHIHLTAAIWSHTMAASKLVSKNFRKRVQQLKHTCTHSLTTPS